MPLSDRIREVASSLDSVADSLNTSLLDRLVSELNNIAQELDVDLPDLSLYRTLDHNPVDADTYREFQRNEWRMYDINCPYDMSHTSNVCGYPNCPES